MLSETKEKLIKFELILKKCILDRFSNNIPQSKIDLLNSSEYINEDELKNIYDRKIIQGKILRSMLNSIINLKSEKEFTLSNEKSISLLYGEDIEKEIIEYYAIDISKRYKFDIDSIITDLSLANKLSEILGFGLDFNILNFDADYILSLDSLFEFSDSYNKKLINQYNSNNNAIESKNDNISNDDVVEVIDSNNSIIQNNISDTLNIEKKDENLIVNKNDNQSILSNDEYKNLCMKFARNEVLTPQEFNLLLMSTPNLVNENEITKISNQSANINFNEQEKMSRGFTDYSFASYYVIISVLIILIIGLIIL